MSNPNIDRIVSKAALRIAQTWHVPYHATPYIEKIIRAAIAKSHELAAQPQRSELPDPDPYDLVPDADQIGAASSEREDLFEYGDGMLGGAASSEPQEWTRQDVDKMLDADGTSAVVLCHNATLKAERERSLQALDMGARVEEELRQQLAAEREKREAAELEIDERGRTIIHYKQELWAAQAAMEKHNALFNDESGMRIYYNRQANRSKKSQQQIWIQGRMPQIRKVESADNGQPPQAASWIFRRH
jgi:hypothetical protein